MTNPTSEQQALLLQLLEVLNAIRARSTVETIHRSDGAVLATAAGFGVSLCLRQLEALGRERDALQFDEEDFEQFRHRSLHDVLEELYAATNEDPAVDHELRRRGLEGPEVAAVIREAVEGHVMPHEFVMRLLSARLEQIAVVAVSDG